MSLKINLDLHFQDYTPQERYENVSYTLMTFSARFPCVLYALNVNMRNLNVTHTFKVGFKIVSLALHVRSKYAKHTFNNKFL